MHTIITYGQIPAGKLREDEAMRDLENWLGKTKMEKFARECREADVSFSWFEKCLGVVGGITGYPVGVWYSRIFPGKATITIPHDGTGYIQ